MNKFDLVILLSFWLLITASLWHVSVRRSLLNKSAVDWLLDLSGLVMQGIVIPALQIGLLHTALHHFIPQLEDVLAFSSAWGFLISFILVDYGYYWNHRWLHQQGWPLHRVHHSVTDLDVLGASRNSLHSSFFILYLWVHTFMLFLIAHPAGYLWGISLTAVLDLWRHSRLGPAPDTFLCRLLAPWLTLPQDHAQHHARHPSANFGANLKLWDRLHGTALPTADKFPEQLGLPNTMTFWQKLLYPFIPS